MILDIYVLERFCSDTIAFNEIPDSIKQYAYVDEVNTEIWSTVTLRCVKLFTAPPIRNGSGLITIQTDGNPW